MANGSFLFGTPSRFETRPIYNQGQQQALNSLLQMGQQNLQNPLQGFNPIRQRAMSNFQQQIVPGLLERFTAMGDNALSSPSLMADLSGAGAGLQERLSALESQYGRQGQMMGLQQILGGLKPLDETIMLGGDSGFLGGMAPGLGQGIAQALPSILMKLLPMLL